MSRNTTPRPTRAAGRADRPDSELVGRSDRPTPLLERLLADAGIGYAVVFDGDDEACPWDPSDAMADRSVAACCAA